MKTILVTGATGFLGRHLVDKFLRDDYNVKCIVRDLRKASHLIERNIPFEVGDLCDPGTAERAVKNVDAVVHAAALLGGWERREDLLRNNVQATQNLLNATATERVHRFIYISSVTSYGLRPDQRLTEESPTKCESDPYCETKLLCEELVRTYANRHGFRATIVRPSIIYGPYDFRFVPEIIRRIRNGTVVAIGRRDQGPPLVYAGDVAAFVSAVLRNQSTGFEIYNLSSPEKVSWERIVREISVSLGTTRRILRIPFRLAYTIGSVLEFLWKTVGASHPPVITRFLAGLIGLSYDFDSSKALSVVEFSGFTPFSNALEATVRWFKEISQEPEGAT